MSSSRYFFRYLLRHGGEPPDTLANAVLETGRCYGASAATVKGSTLVHWADGKSIVPRWAYQAALDLITALGYQPKTTADWLSVIDTIAPGLPGTASVLSALEDRFKVPGHFRANLSCLIEQHRRSKTNNEKKKAHSNSI